MNDVVGSAFEFYVGTILYRIAHEYRNHVELNPIHPGIAYPYSFSYGSVYRTTIFHEEEKRTFGDIDDALRIKTGDTSLLVAIEAKRSSAIQATSAQSRSGLREALTTSYIREKVLDPMRAYTAAHPELRVSDYGFVLVTTRDAIRPHSVLQEIFQESGGYLVGVPAASKEFTNEVKKILPNLGRRRPFR